MITLIHVLVGAGFVIDAILTWFGVLPPSMGFQVLCCLLLGVWHAVEAWTRTHGRVKVKAWDVE